MQEIYINNHTELPNPILIRNLILDDEIASKSHHNMIHLFKLPKIGDYIWDFKLCSPNYYNPNTSTNLNLADFVESIHLAVTCPENVIAHIIENQGLNFLFVENTGISLKMQEIGINFIHEMPLLLSAMYHEDLYIIVKFRKQPPISYNLEYQVGFLDTFNLSLVTNSILNIHATFLRGSNYEMRIMNYRNGKLRLI